MKVPDKLYLSKNIYTTYQYQVPDPNDETAVEYTNTDAFINKACDWIKEHSYDYLEFGEAGFGADFHYPKMIKDFRKAMKGE